MECELGGHSANELYILPIRRENGFLIIFACENCAKMSEVYCSTHKIIHQGFLDGSTACLKCIEEEVRGKEYYAEMFLNIIIQALTEDENESLLMWANASSDITGNSVKICVLRALITKAHRLKIGCYKLLKEIKGGRVESLIV